MVGGSYTPDNSPARGNLGSGTSAIVASEAEEYRKVHGSRQMSGAHAHEHDPTVDHPSPRRRPAPRPIDLPRALRSDAPQHAGRTDRRSRLHAEPLESGPWL